jgi:parallel beta-helix repeat protein/predicted outer membrane repeat protein
MFMGDAQKEMEMKKLIICLTVCVLSGGAVVADTWYVSPGESIQAAIDASQNGDTISIEAGTYYEADINPNGKAITISGETNGKGLPAVTIDGQASGSIVVCNSQETEATMFENLIITNGNAPNGGGIYIEFSNPTLTNCTFISNNASVKGGAIFNSYNDPTITNCRFTDNNSDEFGGAIYNLASTPSFTTCVFTGNTATSNGGGMYNDQSFDPGSQVLLESCTFSNNSSNTNGGGIFNENTTILISNCEFSSNTATQVAGGAISNRGTFCNLSYCTFANNESANAGAILYEISYGHASNCIFESNIATVNHGGAIYIYWNSHPTFSDCTFTSNTAAWQGGAMINDGGSFVTLENCSFVSNSAGHEGGGMRNFNCTPTLTNCTFTSNVSNVGGGGISGEYSNPTLTNCTICGNIPDQITGWDNPTEPNCVTADCSSCDDADGDGVPDSFDQCPNDPYKTQSGICGCGVEDIDTDGDGSLDCVDAFPNDVNEWLDTDGDGIGDNVDNTLGACCLLSGCANSNNPDCTSMGGTWLGEGGVCVNCPTACVADLDGDGEVKVADLLILIAAWGACP